MIDRYVHRCRVDEDGLVVALSCRSSSWSPRSVPAVIEDLESGRFRYLVDWESGTEEVHLSPDPRALGRQVLDVRSPDGRPGGLAQLPLG